MSGANREPIRLLAEAVKAAMPEARVEHGCPQAVSSVPCVTFYQSDGGGGLYADDMAYVDVAAFTVDYWAATWREVEEMSERVGNALADCGFFTVKKEDNVAFNQFNRRDAAARGTERFLFVG